MRFSPSGSHLCTGSSDRTAFLYDGKTGEKIGALGGESGAHKGGIYSVRITYSIGYLGMGGDCMVEVDIF